MVEEEVSPTSSVGEAGGGVRPRPPRRLDVLGEVCSEPKFCEMEVCEVDRSAVCGLFENSLLKAIPNDEERLTALGTI
jgi:hypothetical protein